ncbi:hypothetical protein B9Z55_011392 [Caenorhabditis nigoni]|uniref:Neurotransmitter-gated ion-channel ligand-binding domain-containing protein n=1 Tax=Caenorhabditis nigoni TaxID=1611254 RepID=A0A2G5UJU6_9PELO|nr:hypothetical protein B9Z55_011392 [Caenorhabditis nigoni]
MKLIFLFVVIFNRGICQDNNTLEIDLINYEEKNERTLAKLLLDDYYKYARPVRNSSSILNVTALIQIYNLVEVNEKNEQIQLLLWFPQSWKDEYLTWDPEEWNGIEKIIIPKAMIWVPDGYIFNTVAEAETMENHNARVRYDGKVELVDLTCPMSVSSFPFDSQLCALQFGSWSYPNNVLSFNVMGAWVHEKEKNSEWDIIDFNATKLVRGYNDTLGGANVYEEIFYYLELKRKPHYYIVVIIIPTFAIVTVSNIGLFTPHGVHGDREEHVSLGLTTMLTMAVILDMVTGQMPKSSEGIPLLGKYVLIEFAISIIAVLVSILIIFAHERMLYLEKTPPAWIFRIFEKSYFQKVPLAEMEQDDILSKPRDPKEEMKLCLEKVRNYLEDLETQENHEKIWQRFFSLTDILCGFIFSVINVLVTFYMFIDYF